MIHNIKLIHVDVNNSVFKLLSTNKSNDKFKDKFSDIVLENVISN